MPFFLLSKGSDDRLSLLSEAVFESRSEALAELSRVTSEPGFAGWDDEVLVFELGGGAPVLLMRPATAPVEVVEVAAKSAEVTDVDALGAVVQPPGGEDADVPDEDSDPEDAAVFEAPAIDAEGDFDATEPLGDDEPVVEVDASWADAVAESALESADEISLREALLKTAVHMESEGIVAPDSVGPAPEVAETVDVMPEVETGSEEGVPALEVGELETPAAVDALDAETQTSGDMGESPAWPWDVAASDPDTPTFQLDALEEPGTDEMSLVRAPGDDETMSAARPVIMGAYAVEDGGTAQTQPAADDDAPLDPAGVGQAAEEFAVEPAGEPAEAGADSEISDFILDLESPDPGAAPGYGGGQADLGEMTCNDCVYVETCPHKEGSDPRTCGSFQWK